MDAEARTAGIDAVVSVSAASADLTEVGASDWAHWGDGGPGIVRKASGGSQISEYTVVGSRVPRAFNDSSRSLSWTDGMPTTSQAGNTNGVYVTDGGFSLTVPAGTTPRTVTLYLGGWKSGASLTAHLSDGSAPDYVDTLPTQTSGYLRTFTLTYQAASPNQTLTITWQRVSGPGNVSLSAVALSPATLPSLQGTVSTENTSADLTEVGASDWAHWGDEGSGVVRKAGGGSQISAYTVVGGRVPRAFNDSSRSLSWTDGMPTTSQAGNTNGVYVTGGGFSLTVPAGTTPRTVTLYLGGWKSGASLTAHLSDGSAPDYVDTLPTQTSGYLRTFTLTYQAASPNQTLTITWQRVSGPGNVSLSAVALSMVAPASLQGAVSNGNTSADLTEVGASDWAHWGDGVPGIVRKASGGSQISEYTVVGSRVPRAFNDSSRSLSWADGKPTTSQAGNTNGVYVTGGGFSLTVPAGTTPRTVTLYLGGWKSGASLTAHLSDGSAPDYVDTLPTQTSGYLRTFTLTYQAASPNQTLTITWQRVSGPGNVSLSAIALSTVDPDNRAPVLVVPSGQFSVQGQAVSLTVTANDPDGDTLRYSAAGLPAGLGINAATGVISGTPTSVGTSAVTLAVNDRNGATVSGAFAWSIWAAPSPGSGLDGRPSNISCIAPERPQGGSGVQLARVFPNLGFNLPVGMFQPPSDSSRWYVIEQQTGLVRSFPNKQDAQAADVSTFLSLAGMIKIASETGLLGLAFHPQWPATPQVFIYYTVAGTSPVENRVSRYTSTNGGISLDPASETVILRLVKNQPHANHNGGNIAFGPDGYLYIGTGDGGYGGDPNDNAQNRNVLFGKMLRIDVSPATGYAIPNGSNGNPFAANPQCTDGSGSAPCPEIFAYGLRNPWRWSFDRATGDLWVGDAGQSHREEVDVVRRGANYGWRVREGSRCHNPGSKCGNVGADGEPLVDPVVEYGRDVGEAVTGGYVYRGSKLPGLVGRYVFADYVSSRVFAFQPPDPPVAAVPPLLLTPADALLTATQNVTSMAQGNDGELYVVGYGGHLFGLQPASGGTDTIPTLLSQTGCVAAADAKLPAAGLVPYGVNAPFWSDGADKQRWLALPDGMSITPQTPGHWSPPNGTVLMKNFRVDNRLVETRLLMRHPDGVWAGYTYEWNAAQTDATRVLGGKTQAVGGQTWIYPSENDCLRCHTEVAGRTLGLETAQLNGYLSYPATGRTANQITTLNAVGLLSPAIAGSPSALPAYVDPHGAVGTVEQRARAFLHTNCSQCHQPNGPTPVTLDLRYTTALAQTGTCNAEPTAGTLDLPNARLIVPGAPDSSVLLARVNRRDTFAMPPLGSNLVDTRSVAVLRQWIQGLAGCQ